FASSTAHASSANRIVPPAPGSDGDPTLHGATLRVYNAAGTTSDDVIVMLPSGWSLLGRPSRFKGYRYRGVNPAGPVKTIVVKRARTPVKGGKANWAYTLDEPSQTRVAVQLSLGTASWCASASGKTDKVDRFVGRKSPPPPSCPPTP